MDLNTILKKKYDLNLKKKLQNDNFFKKTIIVIITHWIDFNPPTSCVMNSIDFNNFFIN
jgi:hypothetical protein